MSLSIGIIGLPNVGKSTLFNALLKRQAALSANYPFATIEPNIGVVDVPDKRLKILREIVIREEFSHNFKSEEESNDYINDLTQKPQIIPAVVKFYDIAGLVKDAHKGEGLGNQFLSHIREVDAIIHLIRNFTDSNIINAGSVDPNSDEELINTELLLADLQTIQNRIDSKKTKEEGNFLQKIKEAMEKGIMLNNLDISIDERKIIKELNLLSSKPILLVLNVDENDFKNKHNDGFIRVCAKLEEELAAFDDQERQEYLKNLGIESSGLDKIIKKGYEILGLQTFLTAGPKEVRAWTIKAGSKAPQAAGIIHTDFEKGFIRAEIVSYDDFVQHRGWKNAKEKGLLRSEGREYVMREGDIVEFRFNV